jgi:alkyldihydroxyacetonephosphate synthase
MGQVALGYLSERFGVNLEQRDPAPFQPASLPASRIEPPRSIARLCSVDPKERAAHAYGKSYRDLVRARQGDFSHPPDLVAFPADEDDVVDVLDWCSASGAAAIPYGGGTSVVGGVEPEPRRLPEAEASRPAVTIDLRRLAGLIDVDEVSRTATIRAGTLGPSIEDALRPYDLTLRLFPQSFELSTLGGWIATRAAGHFTTGPTRIDSFVEALLVITPSGIVETLQVPSSGAGPDPNALFLGSEGSLGVITQATVRLLARPRFFSSGVVDFATFAGGVSAVRALAMSGLQPASCRLLDEAEAVLGGLGDGSRSALLLGFESADHPRVSAFERALEICAGIGGVLRDTAEHRDTGPHTGGGIGTPGAAHTGDTATWRETFLAAPYIRDVLISAGVICDTFETAATWTHLEELVEGVRSAAQDAFREAGTSGGLISCRLTHAYPDGAAPYFTVLAPTRAGSGLGEHAFLKDSISAAIASLHGTITHHHAVGRDHLRWYESEAPAAFRRALTAAKQSLDPNGIMNPGVLVSPAS